MAASLIHTTAATGVDSADGKISKNAWNEAHTLNIVATSSAVGFTETAVSGEQLVKITASGQTIALPTAVGNKARLTYKLMVAGTLIIDAAGTETIDDGLTATLVSQYASVTLVSDNANWIIV